MRQTVISYENNGIIHQLAIIINQQDQKPASVSINKLTTKELQMIHHHLVCVREAINAELDRRGV